MGNGIRKTGKQEFEWRQELSAQEIAELAVQALEYDNETYIELLQNENYEEIAYLITEFLVQE